MTPQQRTVVIEFMESLGHTLTGLNRMGIYLAAERHVIDEIRSAEHPAAERIADSIRQLPASVDQEIAQL